MPGNSFGDLFKITTFGESHGHSVGVVIDGCPANLEIDCDFIQKELDKRKPNQSHITTSRSEDDKIEIISGIFNRKALGTPICILVKNKQFNSAHYDNIKDKYRPSHADFTYEQKYGIRDYRGGGRSSARETIARVIGGAIAKLILKQNNIKIFAYVSQIGNVSLVKNSDELNLNDIYKSIVRCPDYETSIKMINLLEQIKQEHDSIGGIITGLIYNCPIGLGEPVFDKLNADLAKAIFSINAVKGFEIGAGFGIATMKGSLANDLWTGNNDPANLCSSNNSGGIQGGISNGMPINFRVAFKPTPTLCSQQILMDKNFCLTELNIAGQHDPCLVPRAAIIVEAMTAIVLVNHLFYDKKCAKK